MTSRVRLDLNSPQFQEDLFGLQKSEQLAVIAALRKVVGLDWNGVYRDSGLQWELLHSRSGPAGARLYSLRITQRCRAVALREGEFMRLLFIHADHDSAYG